MNISDKPKVSICVPNLNTRAFLPERFETIFNQTFQDWELIVYDSFSDDGAWEYIQQLASREPRMKISQGPREGTPGSWNPCIAQARGEYVYIATSDDTMMPDCLEKMVAALESNPDCGICQCELLIIDEKGWPYPPAQQWNHYTLATYDARLVQKKNKRFAPHDGMLHPALFTIYTSVTQVLIRQSVFQRVGMFEKKWGSIGDFEWDMRASLVENCIYIPEKLATWRLHANQATHGVHTPENRLKMIEMTRSAFARAQGCAGSRLKNVDADDFTFFLERDIVALGWEAAGSFWQKLVFIFGQLVQRPRHAIGYVWGRIQKKPWKQFDSVTRHERMKRLLEKYAVPPPVFE
jgi:glycosyltransferase involved in cell wall biosynthesis